MRLMKVVVAISALLLSIPVTAQSELLDDVTTGGVTGMTAMSELELDSVVGEGTSERFISIPHLARSFERTIEAGPNTISIVAVAGSGITITLTGPNIPSRP